VPALHEREPDQRAAIGNVQSVRRSAEITPAQATLPLVINLPAPALPIAGEMLITAFAGSRLRHELDRIPLWQGDDVGVRGF